MMEKEQEGKQIQLLRLRIRKAVEDVIDGVPFDTFKSLYADVPTLKSRKLRGIHSRIRKDIVDGAVNAAHNILKDDEVDETFKLRDELSHQQRQYVGSVAWRPSGSVLDDVRAHDVDTLMERKEQMSVLCNNVGKEMDDVMIAVSKIRRKVQDYQNSLLSMSTKLDLHQESVKQKQATQATLLSSVAP